MQPTLLSGITLHFGRLSSSHACLLLSRECTGGDFTELLPQVFNSRTCQLVLGAGALAAAGLRSITAKHLAMAAQCLGAVITLHPTLTAAFTQPLPQARAAVLLPDFERVLQVSSHPAASARIA